MHHNLTPHESSCLAFEAIVSVDLPALFEARRHRFPQPNATDAAMEVAGLVLGGFSLVISAMEHYGKMEKVGRTWWKFRREHTKDLGRLRDCELLYRANMRTLLAPLQVDGVIDSVQLELLLSSLEDKGWHEGEVESLLGKRLGERKDRYFDNLREMNEAIMKLAKVSMAMDKRFQATLNRSDQVSSTARARIFCISMR